jgi:hypothetical protein
MKPFVEPMQLLIIIVVVGVLVGLYLWYRGRKPPVVTVPEPPNVKVTPADFDGTVTEGDIGGVPVFTGVGRLRNASGQTSLIIATGASPSSVKAYFSEAKFFFQIQDQPLKIPTVNESAEREPNLSVRDMLKDASTESLRIEFDLTPEAAKTHPKGTVVFIVDPSVKQNQYNNYAPRNPSNSTLTETDDVASVTIKVSQGQVEGTLYRRCAAISGQTKRASPGTPKTLTGTGSGSFDLTIKGVSSGTSTYRLTGTWSYDYGNSVPGSSAPQVTCP